MEDSQGSLHESAVEHLLDENSTGSLLKEHSQLLNESSTGPFLCDHSGFTHLELGEPSSASGITDLLGEQSTSSMPDVVSYAGTLRW